MKYIYCVLKGNFFCDCVFSRSVLNDQLMHLMHMTTITHKQSMKVKIFDHNLKKKLLKGYIVPVVPVNI